MIPLATTTIAVLRAPAGDEYAEPYAGAGTATWTRATTGVRAVIGRPSGREEVAGGEQSVWDFQLVCDPVELRRLDQVEDESTGVVYRVVWLMAYPGLVEAGLRLVEGEV